MEQKILTACEITQTKNTIAEPSQRGCYYVLRPRTAEMLCEAKCDYEQKHSTQSVDIGIAGQASEEHTQPDEIREELEMVLDSMLQHGNA